MDLDAAATLIVGNPFRSESSRIREAEKRTKAAPLPRSVEERLTRGHLDRAERLLLARCLVAERNSQSSAKLIPRRIASRLPESLGRYRTTAEAALRCQAALEKTIGDSRAITELRARVWSACFGDSMLHALKLAAVIEDHDILLLGETGTGKEGVAAAIQAGTVAGSPGQLAPTGTLNAAAVPDTLLESELFGHVKGAFTGANETRVGLIRSADGGCFFLDEVGDLPLTTQVKLLRVIETDEVSPLGSDRTHQSQVRYVAATHQNLLSLVEAGSFRRDFYERLAGQVIRLPPLRERPEDIETIGLAFIDRYLRPDTLPEARERAEHWLASPEPRRYEWPGNVRELQNVLRSVMLGLKPDLRSAPLTSLDSPEREMPLTVQSATATLEEVSDWYIRRVYDSVGQNYSQAARRLSVDRTTVARRLREGD